MKITIPGREPLVLDRALIEPESGKFDASTSYASKLISRLGQKSYRMKKLPLKLGALRYLMTEAVAAKDYSSYFEPMAGVGLAARLFNAEDMILNDLDEGCQKVLKANFPNAKVYGKDAATGFFPVADMTFLDFNNYTLSKFARNDDLYGSMIHRAFDVTRRFVIINDCSQFYFRYGAKSYEKYSGMLGVKISTLSEYFEVLPAFYRQFYPEWCLIRVSHIGESSFQLFQRVSLNRKLPLRIDEAKLLPITIHEGLFA